MRAPARPGGAAGAFDAAEAAGVDGPGIPARPASERGDDLAPLWAVANVPIGAAVEPDLLARDDEYARTLTREFNAITPENAMKWGPIHPGEHRWHFDPADRLVAFAEAHRMVVHGHALVWHRQLPPWLDSAMTPRRMGGVLAAHIETLVGRYRGRVASWDVVNEAVADGGGLRATVFRRIVGEGYVAEAFRRTHAADPDARLYYNDYGAEVAGRKSEAVYALVRRLVDAGVPVHGVGLEMHLRATHPPEPDAIMANVARLAELGLEVRISEMDVRIRRIRRGDPLARQRRVYADAIAACASLTGFAGVTFWGVSDRHSWVHEEFGRDAPLLFDRDYAPKPAYYGVREALRARTVPRGQELESTWIPPTSGVLGDKRRLGLR